MSILWYFAFVVAAGATALNVHSGDWGLACFTALVAVYDLVMIAKSES